MGGRLGIHVATGADNAGASARDARRVAGRVLAWSRLLTRHDPESPLTRLNDDRRATVPVRPTLAAALAWAGDAGRMTGGLVDVTRLAERLAAESGGAPSGGPAGPVELFPPDWRLETDGPRRATITRAPGTRFDLDGVGKGWIADRALRLLDGYPGAAVDADGDVAVRVAPGDRWEIGVADPRLDGDLLAVIVLADGPGAPGRGRRTWGVATSGTSVHRFGPGAHHLIDPRTGRPAVTDVIQATVLASGAAAAEAFAKSAVILGSAAGLDFLDRAGVAGAILLLEDGRVLALPRTSAFLA
ncbi:MAG: FAD:protein FMN transferase [Chloroflexota bacterium]